MTYSGRVDIQQVIDESPFSGFHWLLIVLGFLVLAIDGFDTAAGYRARIRNHGHSCFLCEIVIRSQFHTTYEPEA